MDLIWLGVFILSLFFFFFFRSFFGFVFFVMAPVAPFIKKRMSSHISNACKKSIISTLRICLMNIHFRWFNQNQSKSNRMMRWNEIELIFYLSSLKWFHQHITIQKKCILFCGYVLLRKIEMGDWITSARTKERVSEWGRASQGKKQIIKSRINRVWHSCAQSVHSLEWDQILIGSSKNETWKHFIERERQPSKICTKKIKHTRARLPEN